MVVIAGRRGTWQRIANLGQVERLAGICTFVIVVVVRHNSSPSLRIRAVKSLGIAVQAEARGDASNNDFREIPV